MRLQFETLNQISDFSGLGSYLNGVASSTMGAESGFDWI